MEPSGRQAGMAYAAAIALVAPLFAVALWTGFRVARADDLLAVIAPSEQPLTVRSPGGEWTMFLALAWFVLAYLRREATWWETVLVIVGGVTALLRTGNTWVDGVLLIVPLGRQLAGFRLKPMLLGAAAAVGLVVAAVTLYVSRPPALAADAIQAARGSGTQASVFADWRWAPEVQRGLGGDWRVLAAGGLASETPDFWLDYVRIVQDYEAWPSELQRLNVDLLVLDTGQSPLVDQVRASSDWRVVYDSGNALVARRQGT
jgi:hypothetical protein